MAEAGFIILLICLPAAVFSAIAPYIGTRGGLRRLSGYSRYGIILIAGLYSVSLVIMLISFIGRDYSLRIVAEHTSQSLSALYTISALYADKVGSVFLWGWIIAVFAGILALRRKDREESAISLSVLAVIEVFFISLVTLAANVFEKNPSGSSAGFGLNPLLQNFGMLVHPPLLYLSFSGFAIVFALIIAGMITHKPCRELGGSLRGWTIFSWAALGIGNLIGMWWSYNELGWGGYWAWDPVENAGLMPWLTGTALLHSVVMMRRKGYMYRWSLFLAIITFSLTLLSPFITHGGIESPLHGFYGSSFPPYILAAILVTLVVSLVIFLRNRRNIGKENPPDSYFSREGAFLLTNLILLFITLTVFAGTVLPRVTELLGGTKQALGRGYFDIACGPLFLILVLLMGLCPLFGWGKTTWRSLRRNFLYISIAVLLIAAIILVSGGGVWYAVAVVICGLPLLSIVLELVRGTVARHRSSGEKYIRGLLSVIGGNRARYGGLIAHTGIVLIALGIMVSSFYSLEKTETMKPGDSMDIGSYRLTYENLTVKQDISKASYSASVSVEKSGRPKGMLSPSLDYWYGYDDYFSEVSVRSTPVEDLFVSLAWTEQETVILRVLVNPLIVWIWAGGFFLLAGGIISFSSGEQNIAAVQD